MKSILSLSTLVIASLAFGTAHAATDPAAGPSDAEIAQIVVSANDNEIDAAKLAQSKSKNKDVKSFAQMMEKEHNNLKKSTTDLAKKEGFKTKESDASKNLAQEGKDNTSELKKLKGASFDKAYIDQQVAAHEAVLKDIDNTLLPNAKDEQLKDLLTKARPAVEKHLQHAKELQAKLESSSTE